MGFKYKTKILFLIPNVNTSISSSRITNTIFIKWSAVESCLSILLSKGTVFEKFLASICWVPKLERSSCHSNKLEIIWLLWPLNVEDGISSCRKSQKHLLSLNIVDIHVVIIALINTGNISLAWTNWQSCNTFGAISKWKLSNWTHCQSIPYMTSRKLSTLTSGNNISELSSSNIKSCDIILMERVVLHVLFGIFWFFTSSKEFLLSCFEILTNSYGSCCKNNFIIIFSEMKSIFVSISWKTIDMINLVGMFRFGWIIGNVSRRLFIDLLKEGLISFFFFRCFFWHFF